MPLRFSKKFILIFSFVFLFFVFPSFSKATTLEFNIEPSYDYIGRSKVTAFFQQAGENVSFYLEEDYYNNLDLDAKKNLSLAIKNLSQEFDSKIYPQLREAFGSEWSPGIDGDKKITILLSRLKSERGGYFNAADEYLKLQIPKSNEKEMIYLNVDYVETPISKSYLAHEFTHLINFNQKDKKGLFEDTWLNEGRAELAPTILGYDSVYQGSYLQKRVRTFLQNSTDPLTEWNDLSDDYGVSNVFFQYFLDQYGIKVLKNSFLSSKTGITSLNESLKKEGFTEDFAQVFTNWTIAVLINDCSLGPKYCYLNPNLKNLGVMPKINYLPIFSESTLTATNYTKNWAGNWFKFIGGNKGTFKLEFAGEANLVFRVPYLLRDFNNKYSLYFLKLDSSQQATVYLSDFGNKYESITILPSIQNKTSGFEGIEKFDKFIWSASIVNSGPNQQDQELINSLLAQIDYLKKQIALIQAQIKAASGGGGTAGICKQITVNLYYGMQSSSEVSCLQSFLKSQGQAIYPEGLVTGNFFYSTQAAVIRFQEKYKSEILTPSGLSSGTGFVGPSTRAKINQLLSLSQ